MSKTCPIGLLRQILIDFQNCFTIWLSRFSSKFVVKTTSHLGSLDMLQCEISSTLLTRAVDSMIPLLSLPIQICIRMFVSWKYSISSALGEFSWCCYFFGKWHFTGEIVGWILDWSTLVHCCKNEVGAVFFESRCILYINRWDIVGLSKQIFCRWISGVLRLGEILQPLSQVADVVKATRVTWLVAMAVLRGWLPACVLIG